MGFTLTKAADAPKKWYQGWGVKEWGFVSTMLTMAFAILVTAVTWVILLNIHVQDTNRFIEAQLELNERVKVVILRDAVRKQMEEEETQGEKD